MGFVNVRFIHSHRCIQLSTQHCKCGNNAGSTE
jgi:hypothetical protein